MTGRGQNAFKMKDSAGPVIRADVDPVTGRHVRKHVRRHARRHVRKHVRRHVRRH